MNSLKNSKSYQSFIKSPYFSSKHISYFPVYDKYFKRFKNTKIVLVEVGVFSGGSLFMWRNFFGKKARIIGIDMDPNAKKWESKGFEIYIGDQSNPEFWLNFFNKVGSVDIIIDDGGHTYEQQIVTATTCIPYIKNGGILLVEDIHTSFFSEFGFPSKYTFFEWAKSKIVDLNARYIDTKLPITNFSKRIESINFHESIIVFMIAKKFLMNSPIENNGKRDGARDFRYEKSHINVLLKAFRILEKKYPLIFKTNLLTGSAKILMNLYTKFAARARARKLKKYF